jgi:hypothetical protein
MIHELKMIPPAAPSFEAMKDGQSAIFAQQFGRTVIVVYCKRNQAGATWLPIPESPGVGLWTSMSPVSIDEYLQALKVQDVTFPSSPDLERWVAHVTGRTSRTN